MSAGGNLGPAPTSTGQPAQIGGFGGGGGGFGGGGGGAANYDPSANASYSGFFGNSGGKPAPGQMNWQVTDAEKANLLRQQNSGPMAPPQQAPIGAPMPVGFNPNPDSTPAPQQPYQRYQPQQRTFQPQQQMPNYQSGLQAALMQMMQQYSRPAMRAPLQQGISPSNPMAYRPPAVNNLNRVAPSVELQQKQAAEEAAKKAAEEAAKPKPAYVDSGGGGG